VWKIPDPTKSASGSTTILTKVSVARPKEGGGGRGGGGGYGGGRGGGGYGGGGRGGGGYGGGGYGGGRGGGRVSRNGFIIICYSRKS
jgi:hypothetical protein